MSRNRKRGALDVEQWGGSKNRMDMDPTVARIIERMYPTRVGAREPNQSRCGNSPGKPDRQALP